jgi:hypothetical protein
VVPSLVCRPVWSESQPVFAGQISTVDNTVLSATRGRTGPASGRSPIRGEEATSQFVSESNSSQPDLGHGVSRHMSRTEQISPLLGHLMAPRTPENTGIVPLR